MISEEIRHRAAIGPGEGKASRLVGVSGTSHGWNNTAIAWVRRELGVPKENIIAAEYAGRADWGDPVFLVTWRTQ